MTAAGSKISTGRLTSQAKNIYKIKQKVLSAICKSRTHVLMCSKEENGGYEFARDESGKVRFSESTMRMYWPNWVIEMNEDHMNMCACETCQTMDDAHVAMIAKRGKMMKRDEARLEELTGNTRSVVQERTRLTNILEEYKSQVRMTDDEGVSQPIHVDGWEACGQYGCNKRVSINVGGKERSFLHYSCQKGGCKECDAAGYTPPLYETTHIDKEEIIKFSKFQQFVSCTYPGHGAGHIKEFPDEPKLRCMWCEENENNKKGWKKKNKATVSNTR